MKNIQLKLFLIHIGVFSVSVFGFTYFFEYLESEQKERIYSTTHFIIVVALYIISGYVLTDDKSTFKIKNYSGIAFIGCILWVIAVVYSPNDLNWISGEGGTPWFLYRLYISPIETPFNFLESYSEDPENLKIRVVGLLVLTIIPSALQTIGGFVKIKKSV